MIVDLEDSEVIDTFNKLEEMGIDIYIEEDEEQVNNLLFFTFSLTLTLCSSKGVII